MKLRITLEGTVYEVDVEVVEADATGPAPAVPSSPRPSTALVRKAPLGADGRKVPSPLVGVISELRVSEGDRVQAGAVVAILEAMKMETEILAPRAATVEAVLVAVGDTVRQGQAVVELSVD
jgi:methylmalonyl-CoA carboxyltransferase small subunit